MEWCNPVNLLNIRDNQDDDNIYNIGTPRKGFNIIVAESPNVSELRTSAPQLHNLDDTEAIPQMTWLANQLLWWNNDYYHD